MSWELSKDGRLGIVVETQLVTPSLMVELEIVDMMFSCALHLAIATQEEALPGQANASWGLVIAQGLPRDWVDDKIPLIPTSHFALGCAVQISSSDYL